MAILGMGNGALIQQIIQTLFQMSNRRRLLSTPMCDSQILKLHYKWTFALFMFGFATVTYNWYFQATILCTSTYNAETQVSANYMNLCSSYPFVQHENHREYLLYYRWIPLTLLAIAAIFYIPRKFSKYSENPKIKQLMEEMAQMQCRYDQNEQQVINRATVYIAYNTRTHNWLFVKYIGCVVVCLLIDILVFYGLDVFLLGKFSMYGIHAIPFNRDPVGFTDYISRVFPPFVDCEIAPVHQLLNKRIERFGCHLPIQEFYEKIFFIIWFWLIFLIIITSLYLIALALFVFLPYIQLMLLRIPKPARATTSVRKTILKVMEFSKIGDIYLLYRLKQYSSAAMYYEILNQLATCEVLLNVIKKEPENRGDVINVESSEGPETSETSGSRNGSSSDDSFSHEHLKHRNRAILLP